jgi:hypothetical protein
MPDTRWTTEGGQGEEKESLPITVQPPKLGHHEAKTCRDPEMIAMSPKRKHSVFLLDGEKRYDEDAAADTLHVSEVGSGDDDEKLGNWRVSF